MSAGEVIAIVPPTSLLLGVPGGWWRAARAPHPSICPQCGRVLPGRPQVRYEPRPPDMEWRVWWPCEAGCDQGRHNYLARHHVRELGPWLPAHEPHEVAV